MPAARKLSVRDLLGAGDHVVADAVENADFVIVAVKPSDVDRRRSTNRRGGAQAESDSAEQVFVTVAAGVSTGYYESKLPAGTPVIRVMPNAPIVVGGGVSALSRGPVRHRRAAQRGGRASSTRSAACSPCPSPSSTRSPRSRAPGPAYFFLIVEALVDAAVAAGLSRAGGHRSGRADHGRLGGDVAGAPRRGEAGSRDGATMGTAIDTTAAQLRATVTSPGGTTAAGLRELERGGLAGRGRRGRGGRENPL